MQTNRYFDRLKSVYESLLSRYTNEQQHSNAFIPVLQSTMVEGTHDYRVCIQAPELAAVDVNAAVDEDYLVIRAEAKTDVDVWDKDQVHRGTKMYMIEGASQGVIKKFLLPHKANPRSASATFTGDMLTIILPKSAIEENDISVIERQNLVEASPNQEEEILLIKKPMLAMFATGEIKDV
jgi:HSP20 family molecular chaperone IbpA